MTMIMIMIMIVISLWLLSIRDILSRYAVEMNVIRITILEGGRVLWGHHPFQFTVLYKYWVPNRQYPVIRIPNSSGPRITVV